MNLPCPSRFYVLQLQLLLIVAVALGGGGVAYGLRNVAIQLFALALIWWHRTAVWDFFRNGPSGLVALVLASMALPLVQLIPLPPEVWQAFPGRALAAEALRIASVPADAWQPLTLDRGRTMVAFCGTLAPAAIIVLGARLAKADKARLALTLIAAVCAGVLWGFVQLSSANTTGVLFPITPKPDVLYATFANRNSTGAMLALAIAMLAVVPLPRGRRWLAGAAIAAILLLLGSLLTQSRSGMVLAGMAVGFMILRAVLAGWAARTARMPGLSPSMVAGAGLALLAGIALALAAMGGGRAADSLARLGDSQTDRPQIWEDARFAAQHYWPVGSGMGTFDEVFQLHESLENISPRRAGRAHSDWLELTIEAGLAGLMLAFAWIGWCLYAAFAAPHRERWMAWGANCGMAMIALQSLLDYPLRNQTMLCAAAMLIVMLARPKEQRT